jgi:hypothetical protein
MSPVLWGIVFWGHPGRGTARLVVACSSDHLWALVDPDRSGLPRPRGGRRTPQVIAVEAGIAAAFVVVAAALADWCQGVVELTTAIRTRRVRLTVAPAQSRDRL